MSVFSVPVTIGVNEENIAREIEKNVEQQVVNKVFDEVKEIIYHKDYYRGRQDENPEPLRRMVEREIEKKIIEKEDVIIEVAATKLAEKLVRTKAVRERAAAVAKEVLK